MHLFTDSAIDEIDPIEEIDHVHRQPVIEVLTLRQLHHLTEWIRELAEYTLVLWGKVCKGAVYWGAVYWGAVY